MRAYDCKVESDESGFELVLWIEDDEHETVRFNIQECAEALYDAVRAQIGPWLQERDEARASRPRPYDGFPDDDLPWPGESTMDFYRRTGNAEPALDAADFLRDRMRGK